MQTTKIDNEIQALITQAVKNILGRVGSAEAISVLNDKHAKKVHFIPRQYRVFGGMLQSMNIQFGNFVEELMSLLVRSDGRYEIVEEYSGRKDNNFYITSQVSLLIDRYIDNCQLSEDGYCNVAFPVLQQSIISDKSGGKHSVKHDIDLLFKNKSTGKYIYVEIKYNDDHDTGKFVDINRKFIKTYAYLVKALGVSNIEQLTPILFFFNKKKMKGNPYLPEEVNIRRGARFFDEYLSKVKYDDLSEYMRDLSESSEVKVMFDDLYDRVVTERVKLNPQNAMNAKIINKFTHEYHLVR